MVSCSCDDGMLGRDSAGCEDVYVCTNCGRVSESSELNISLERTGIESGTYVRPDGVIRDTARILRYRTAESKRTAKENMWLEKLNQTSKLLRIPAHTAKLADNYFKSVFWEDPFRYKREALIPGCIYAACRKENVPLTLKQLSDCCYKSVPEIGRAFKLLVKELTLELPVVHREQIVETMCNQVGIPETIVSKVIGTARRLCGLLDEIGMSDHKGANLLAGVCIAIAWQAKEPTKNGKVPCANKFVKVCGTHSHTFSRTYHQVREVLVQLCKHLPWVKGDISESHVLVQLEKILDFQQILIEKVTQQLEIKSGEATGIDDSEDEIDDEEKPKRSKMDSTETENLKV